MIANLVEALRWLVIHSRFPLVLLCAVVFCLLFLERPVMTRGALSRKPDETEGHMALAARVNVNTDEAGSGGREGEEWVSSEDGDVFAHLVPGDILLGRCRLSLVPSLDPARGWTHAAIYVGNGEIVVASNPLQGVLRTSVRAWDYPHMTWVTCLRVVSATEEERKEAARFALEKVGSGYDLNWFSEQVDGEGWYCSELVWAAYYEASGGRVDLEEGFGLFGVSPDDILRHGGTEVIGGHYERKPDTALSLLAKAFLLSMSFGAFAELFRNG